MGMKPKIPSRDEIYRKLRKHYASESEQVLREASYNLAIASVEETSLLDKAAQAIQRISQTAAQRSPLASQQAQQRSADIQSCPICRIAMSSVKLLEEKPAWFCADHRIIVPKPIE